MSGPSARSWRGENNPTPGRLAHLKAEIAASDRTLPLRKFNYRNEDLRQMGRRSRKMRNAGMRPENAMNPAWDWLSGGRLSRLPLCLGCKCELPSVVGYGPLACESCLRSATLDCKHPGANGTVVIP